MTEKTGVGRELAAAREARGLALADVAQQLKFAPRQLEALEQENIEALPGHTITRGMVRNYARLLKLDAEPLVQRISRRFEMPDSNRLAQRYHEAVPFSDRGRRSTLVYLGMSLGVLALVAGVAYQWHHERSVATKALPSVASFEPTPEAEPAPVVLQEKVSIVAAPVEPPAAPVAPVAPKLVSDPVVPKAGPPRLVVRTHADAWIEIRDSLDRMLVASLNPAGSERVVGGRPPYSLVIGNAANVRVTYGDKPIDLAPHTRHDVARLTVP
jgi:cytoskeleton protein RodZ